MTARQLQLDLGQRTALGAEDFLPADSNRAALAWLDRWPDWPAPALVIHGPPGCGKSHLTALWCVRSGALPLPPTALAAGDPSALLAANRALAVDDADRVAGDAAAERGLLHLYNLVGESHLADEHERQGGAGGHLLLTARTPPARWGLVLPDLASRLRAAPAVAVAEPDDALLAAVLVKLFADRQLRIGEEVIGFLVPRMERSFAAARDLVQRLDAASLERQRAITVRLAGAVLGASRTWS